MKILLLFVCLWILLDMDRQIMLLVLSFMRPSNCYSNVDCFRHVLLSNPPVNYKQDMYVVESCAVTKHVYQYQLWDLPCYLTHISISLESKFILKIDVLEY